MREAETGSGAGPQPDVRKPAKLVPPQGTESSAKPGPAGAIDERLVSLLAPASFEAEQYRALRHVVEECRSEMTVIAVTSAAPGEGKTTTAINLAAALAQDAHSRILLLDADLRVPSVGRLLGFGDSPPGLAEAAREPGADLDDLVRRRPPSRLSILPAGKTLENPYETLKSPRIGEIVQEARRRYDTVVIDTPPIVPVPDSRVLAKWVDGFLLVVAAHRTPRHLVEEALHLLSHAKVAGIVFNGDDRPSSAYYGYYYGYGRTRGVGRADQSDRPAGRKVASPWR